MSARDVFSLRDFQVGPVDALSRACRGVLKAPAGSGKTVMGAAAIEKWLRRCALGAVAFVKKSVVWLGHTTEQCDQARAALRLFPRIAQMAEVTVGCYQGAADGDLALKISSCDLLVADECHHAAAPEFAKAVRLAQRMRWGLSATPDRADLLAPLVYELLGPIVAEVEREGLVEAGHLAHGEVVWIGLKGMAGIEREVGELARPQYEFAMGRWLGAAQGTLSRGVPLDISRPWMMKMGAVRAAIRGSAREFDRLFRAWLAEFSECALPPVGWEAEWDSKWERWDKDKGQEQWNRCIWQFALKLGVTECHRRNRAAIVQAAECVREGHSTLVLVNTVEHGTMIAEEIWKLGGGAGLCHSKIGKKARREMMEAFRGGSLPCLVATSLADEGFDAPRASRLVLVSAGRSAIKAEQRTGRVLRAFAGKEWGVIYDFEDQHHPFLRAQARARSKVYAGLGYEQRQESPSGSLLL